VSDAIRSIEVGVARLDLPSRLRIGRTEIGSRQYAAVRVTTTSGLVGKAMCLTRDAPVAECVDRLVAPALLGAESVDPGRCFEIASRATIFVGRIGLVVRAVGLVDVALWDIAAQRAGVPLWQLLEGSDAPVPVMLVAAYPVDSRSPESLADDVIRGSEQGYALLKVARDRDPARMRRLLEIAHGGLAGGSRIVVDAAYAWSDPREAIVEVDSWGDTPLAWLEDPVVPEDAAACALIRREGRHPIGEGDEVSDRATYARLLEEDALDVVRVDVVAVGGVTVARTIQAMAAARGLPVSFHVYPELSVHLATVGAGIIETFDREAPGGNPLDPAHRLIVTGALAIERGTAIPPSAPGLGFDLDWPQFGFARG
jgi:L-alanine-DL-glutamate epimerase-like enolase superfamily enzyme